MALTASQRVQTVIGKLRMHVYDVTFDSSYPTGGEDLLPSLVGLNSIYAVNPAVNGSEFAVYNYATKKLQLFTADGSEAADASNQSAVSVTCFVYGI